jgi:hypothetical protein
MGSCGRAARRRPMPCRDVNVALVARLNNITFACEEPVRLAEFWREALGYEHIETPDEDPEGNGFCVS